MPRWLVQTLLFVVPLVVAFALLPQVYSNQLMLFNFVIFLTLAQGVNVLYGFTGYLPFGYVGFFGAGAYGFSLAVMHLNSPALPALLCAGVAAVLLGLLLTPLLRLSGAYFSIASLAASLAVLQFVANPALEPITKGPYGVALRGVFDPKLAYATAVAIMAATMLVVVWLRNSQFGLSLQALREDAVSASMAGINVVRSRTIAWIISALIAGFAGGVYAWYVSVFYPETVFGLPELDLGLVPGAGGTVSVPRRIGRWRTAYLVLTGRRIDAATALRWGLVDEVSESSRPVPPS